MGTFTIFNNTDSDPLIVEIYRPDFYKIVGSSYLYKLSKLVNIVKNDTVSDSVPAIVLVNPRYKIKGAIHAKEQYIGFPHKEYASNLNGYLITIAGNYTLEQK